MLFIKTIMENQHFNNRSLSCEHGLSFYIEYNQHKLLFDFGQTCLAAENAKKLNINLKQIEYSIISHSHYDHSGGYPYFVREGLSSPLITGKGFWYEKYTVTDLKYSYLGCCFNSDFLTSHHIEHRTCQDILELFPGCYVVGSFDRTCDFEKNNPRFVKRCNEDCFIIDDFEDELCLAMKTEKGLVVIVGCSHPGIVNMLTKISSYFNSKIYAVIGGTHLVEADENRIQKTIAALKEMEIKLLCLNHCTGTNGENILAESSIKTLHLATGDCIVL